MNKKKRLPCHGWGAAFSYQEKLKLFFGFWNFFWVPCHGWGTAFSHQEKLKLYWHWRQFKIHCHILEILPSFSSIFTHTQSNFLHWKNFYAEISEFFFYEVASDWLINNFFFLIGITSIKILKFFEILHYFLEIV